MIKRTGMVWTLLLALPTSLRAAEGDCGGIPDSGQCRDATLLYCEDPGTPNERLVRVDCAAGVFPADITGLCITVNASYGQDCAVPSGTRCVFAGSGGETVVAFCDGVGAGCVVDDVAHSSRCASGLGSCSMPAPGTTFTPVCAGDALVLGCQQGQPFAMDCLALGGSCSAGACRALPVDAPCDATQRLCDTGLQCHAELGRCVDPAATCDPATAVPSCDGSALRYCATPHDLWQQVDCQVALGADSAMTCGPAFDCVDDGSSGACAALAVACVGAAAGSRCSVEQGLFCGAGLGCVMQLDAQGHVEERCRSTARCALGEAHRGCAGEIATSCVGDGLRAVADAAGIDCAALGSHCVDDAVAGPLCVGAAGARCDDPALVPDSPFRCAAGLTCVQTSQLLGTCVPPATDAGTGDAIQVEAGVDAAADAGQDAASDAASDAGGEPDARVDAGRNDAGTSPARDAGPSGDDGDDGCCCRGRAQGASGPGLLGLGGLLLWRRRRPRLVRGRRQR